MQMTGLSVWLYLCSTCNLGIQSSAHHSQRNEALTAVLGSGALGGEWLVGQAGLVPPVSGKFQVEELFLRVSVHVSC